MPKSSLQQWITRIWSDQVFNFQSSKAVRFSHGLVSKRENLSLKQSYKNLQFSSLTVQLPVQLRSREGNRREFKMQLTPISIRRLTRYYKNKIIYVLHKFIFRKSPAFSLNFDKHRFSKELSLDYLRKRKCLQKYSYACLDNIICTFLLQLRF